MPECTSLIKRAKVSFVKRRLSVLILTFFSIVAVCVTIFPPWVHVVRTAGTPPDGHFWIWDSVPVSDRNYRVIDYDNLFLTYFTILAFLALSLWLARRLCKQRKKAADL
ncbi:MAG: hypothetical protein BGO12_15185 [Verrucomicrobia bacterium 61-8]|nr:MAG: hypothetical protein BGO12_15185 [Verrucomicrobia bacterium 61-8]